MADPNLASLLASQLGLGGGASSAPPAVTPSGSPIIPGAPGSGRNTAGFMGIEALGAIPTNVTADAILKNLDKEFVQRYVMKLEEAKILLKGYLSELGNLTKRLAKADSAIRMVLGEREIEAKKAAIEETISKLTAHQKKTYERLTK